MKEEYYLIPKSKLDSFFNENYNNVLNVNFEAKLIDLSDEAILDKKNLQIRKSVTELDRIEDFTEFQDGYLTGINDGYKQALKDLKQ